MVSSVRIVVSERLFNQSLDNDNNQQLTKINGV